MSPNTTPRAPTSSIALAGCSAAAGVETAAAEMVMAAPGRAARQGFVSGWRTTSLGCNYSVEIDGIQECRNDLPAGHVGGLPVQTKSSCHPTVLNEPRKA